MKRELDAVQRMAAQAGVNIQRGISGGGGGRSGTSGIMSEALVLARELGRGNFSRIPGSFSILANRMGLLKYIIKDTATASEVLAAAWQQQAEKASLAAIASTRKAAASAAALAMTDGETEANLAAAIADEEKAAADILVAKTTQAKAVASAEAAAASRAEAGAAKLTIAPLGAVVGILAAIAVGAYAASKLASKLTESLAGVKPPDFEPEYIVKRLQHANAAAEGEREINLEIQKRIDLYESASKAAERVEKTTKTHFEHIRKMHEYEKEAELAKAKTAGQKKAVEEKYSKIELADKQTERDSELTDKQNLQKNLQAESEEKKRRANAIDLPSEKHEEQTLELAKEKLKTIRDADKAVSEAKNDPGFLNTVNGRDVFRAYNKVAASGVSGKDLDAAEMQIKTDKINQQKEVRRLMEQKDANDIRRKERDELNKSAVNSAGKAVETGKEIEDLKKNNAQTIIDEQAEAAAKLKAEDSKADKQTRKGRSLSSISEWERGNIGLGLSSPAMKQVDIAGKSLNELRKIHTAMTAHPKFAGRGVRF